MFWGYQLFIVLAATGYLLGATQSKEYAEPEWYVDIWLTVVWLAYLAVYLGTIVQRRERHIYVANWFLLSFIITVAMLHLVNNMSLPVSLWGSKSVQVFSGVQDAMTQWWYGHNAVGFFLTAGFLGMMYYFVPKQAGRPVYSYRLSIVHFWALALYRSGEYAKAEVPMMNEVRGPEHTIFLSKIYCVSLLMLCSIPFFWPNSSLPLLWVFIAGGLTIWYAKSVCAQCR